MKFTQLPANCYENIALNAGILVASFVPSTQVLGDILGATSGGVNFTATPEIVDFGDDIDNCPKNTKELARISGWTDVTLSGTFVTVTAALAKKLVGAADLASGDNTHIVPRADLATADFTDLWWVGDYSNVNTGSTAGFCAIHMSNALSTGGFQIQSNDKAKGTFAFTFTAHYTLSTPDVVPFEIYVSEGSA